jgi:aspartyl-tRNA(Asn)/glutamyl-tRNA(Gln) amidotransferase subunit A
VHSSLDGTRIGRSANLMGPGLDPSVGEVYERAIDTLGELGAEVVEVDLPSAASCLEAFVPLQMAEAHHVHNQSMGIYPEHGQDYGADVRSRLDAAASVTVADYLRAQEERRRIIASFDRQLQFIDALISPISAVGPSRIDNSDEGVLDGEIRPLRELVMPFTVPQNLTGLPTGIVGAGHDSDRLPVGVQLTAPRWREDTAVAISGALQFALGSIETAEFPNRPDGS